MWPILALSIVAVGVVIERFIFLASESRNRDKGTVQKVFSLVEQVDRGS